MSETSHWTTRKLEQAVSEIMGVANDKAFKARIENLARKGLIGTGAGRGTVARHSTRTALDVLMALHLGRVGVSPAHSVTALIEGKHEIDAALEDEKPCVYMVGRRDTLAQPFITRWASSRSMIHIYIDLDYLVERLRGQEMRLKLP